jgi:hypothetical protein
MLVKEDVNCNSYRRDEQILAFRIAIPEIITSRRKRLAVILCRLILPKSCFGIVTSSAFCFSRHVNGVQEAECPVLINPVAPSV